MGAAQSEASTPSPPMSDPLAARLADVEDRSKVDVTVGGHDLMVEVVNTPGSTRQGLGGRDAVGSDGMLFVPGLDGEIPVWMKGMSFDIDLVWLDGPTIVDIEPRVPAPGASVADADLPVYTNAEPATLLLELPSGAAGRLGLEIGDRMRTAPAAAQRRPAESHR